MRRTLVSILATVGALVAAAPASAGTLTTHERVLAGATTRRGSHMNVDLAGTASPNPAAPGLGRHAHADVGPRAHPGLPRSRPSTGNLEILKPGRERDPREGVGRARRRRHAAGRRRCMQLDSGRANDRHRRSRDGTLSVHTDRRHDPAPDTAWTVGTSGSSGSVRPAPARCRRSPRVPAERGHAAGQRVHPHGAPGSLAMRLDCQPGSGRRRTGSRRSTAGAFETVGDPGGRDAGPRAQARARRFRCARRR